MHGLRSLGLLVLGTGVLVAACDRDEEGGALATAPTLASAAGQCRNNTVSAAVRDAFTDNTTRQNVQTLAQDMTQAFGDGEVGKATWLGFQILEAVDTAARLQVGAKLASNLAVATFPCMSLGSASIPDSVTTELGATGAFGVRGRFPADDDAVIAYTADGKPSWILQPPVGKTWYEITTLQARTGITGDTAELFLALGKPGSGTGFNAPGDQLLAASFNWSTIPSATFGNPYVVVGNCDVGGGFLQHFPASNQNAEIFGFVQPDCPGEELTLERAPRSLAERLFRALSPAPAYATALLKSGTGGGTKPSLSPFGIIHPGQVNLGTFTQSPKKSGNVTNSPLQPTPTVKPKSAGGVSFKQASVLSYLQPIINNGTPGRICFNWAYNDDLGVTDFDRAVYTKAGGVSLFAVNVGTVSTPESTGEDVPFVEGGTPATSTAFNVKNNGTTLAVCPVFDGVTYYTNILDPAAEQKTFNPTDASTFPPNYDDTVNFPFPGYQFQ